MTALLPPALQNILERLLAALPDDRPVYLVGGAVRDLLLRQEPYDLDFAIAGDGLFVARKVANSLGAAYYPLDEERLTGRCVLNLPEGQFFLDFASLRGPDLESDLRGRDFTINAIALDIRRPQALIDPLGGASDLQHKVLRACSPQTFASDPVRLLRAVRQAAAYGLLIQPETRSLMRAAVPGLQAVSPERLRDEFFKILAGPQPAASIRALEILNILEAITPELIPMQGVAQTAPHTLDVWRHSLEVMQRLEQVLEVLQPVYDPDMASNLAIGLVVLHLGRFREQIGAHLAAPLNPQRSARSLLMMAALYHDVGKPGTRRVDENGRARFFNHEDAGAEIVEQRADAMRLSNPEIERLRTVVSHHLRPILLSEAEDIPSRRAIYRFFRATGVAGVDICLLSLADVWGAYGPTLPTDRWTKQLEVVRALLEAWWEHPEQSVSPPPVLTGHDLMEQLQIPPGPLVGQLLDAIREAQASGQVQDQEQALNLARSLIATGRLNENE